MLDFEKIHTNSQTEEDKKIQKEKIRKDLRLLNNNFTIFKYQVEDQLGSIEQKILNRIDIELAHKNPNSSISVTLDAYGKYNMSYSSGTFNINKTCADKIECFKRLKSFIYSIREMPF